MKNIDVTSSESTLQIAVIVGSVVAALLIAALLILVISRGILSQLGFILGVFEGVRMENYDVRAEVISSDELGDLAKDLNTTVDKNSNLTQSFI